MSDKYDEKFIGNTIRYLRIHKNIKQEKLSLITNISTSIISRIENGKIAIPISTINHILYYLDIEYGFDHSETKIINLLFKELYYNIIFSDDNNINEIWHTIQSKKEIINKSINRYRYYFYEYLYNLYLEENYDINKIEILIQNNLLSKDEIKIIDIINKNSDDISKIYKDIDINLLLETNKEEKIILLYIYSLKLIKDQKYTQAMYYLNKTNQEAIDNKDMLVKCKIVIAYILYKIGDYKTSLYELNNYKNDTSDDNRTFAKLCILKVLIKTNDNENVEKMALDLENEEKFEKNLKFYELILRYYLMANNKEHFNKWFDKTIEVNEVDIDLRVIINVYYNLINKKELDKIFTQIDNIDEYYYKEKNTVKEYYKTFIKK